MNSNSLIGGQNCPNLPIGFPWFACQWFGIHKPTANQMYQNPNQFFRHPNQNVSYPNHFSQIANRHANHFGNHPNRHSIPDQQFANRCQSRSGIRNPGQYNCCVSTLRHHWYVSTSFRFRVGPGRLEFYQCPEQRNRMQLRSHCLSAAAAAALAA